MEQKLTPLLPGARRILISTWQAMTPEEIKFWERVRYHLRSRNYELMMIGYFFLKEPMDVPYMKVNNDLDAFKYLIYDEKWGAWFPDEMKFDEEKIFKHERLWNCGARDEAQKQDRRKAMSCYGNFYAAILNGARPVLTATWNGTHAQEQILIDLCRKCGCPVAYLERGPFAETVFLDEEGILFGSSISKMKDFNWTDGKERKYWREVLDRLKSEYERKKSTWWEQPESKGASKLKERLNIDPGKKVVMFAGQKDRDSQNFFYSPHFDNNLEAFKWFCDTLSGRDDIFILGKHHPRSEQPVKEYRRVVNGQGVWLDDASLDDCLALSERVAAVNSTVLFEALLVGKPALFLGQSFLADKNIAYEVKEPGKGSQVIGEWLAAKDFKDRYERWLDFGAFLLSKSLYSIHPAEKALGQNDSTTMAERLIKMAERNTSPNYDQLKPFCYNSGLLFMELTQFARYRIYVLPYFLKKLYYSIGAERILRLLNKMFQANKR